MTEFDAYSANYTSLLLNYTTLSILLQQNPSNATLASEVGRVNASLATQLSAMRSTLNKELASLASFGVSQNMNETTPSAMAADTQTALTKANNLYENKTMSSLRSLISFSSYSFQQTTPTLGRFFLSQLRNIIITAFILVFIVVFLIFRSLAPSVTVVFGAANDLIVALGAMGLFGIPLGVPSIAALLMLLGYSIDTDALTRDKDT